MPMPVALTLSKEERLSSRTLIESLFNGSGSRSMAMFPLRMVYMKKDRKAGEPGAMMLVSVPKRQFKHAVDRNRVKRQVREAFRHHKHLIPNREGTCVIMAFIWLDSKLHDSEEVNNKVKRLLERVTEKV